MVRPDPGKLLPGSASLTGQSLPAIVALFETLAGAVHDGLWFRQSRCKSGSAAQLAENLWLSAETASLLTIGSAGRLSLPAEPRTLVTVEANGKAKPFRKSGGRAALGCYLSGTLTRPPLVTISLRMPGATFRATTDAAY